METILDFFKDSIAMLPTIKVMDVIDIVVVAFIIYAMFMMIQTTGAARIAKSVIFILVLAALTDLLHMYLLNYILDMILEIGLIVLVVIFQPEIRRILEKIGGRSIHELLLSREEERDIDRVIKQTVTACEFMSKEKTGALIVFENKDSLIDHVKSGTKIDAQVTTELLRNIFFTKAALHDGAVIISKDRLAAAGCVLPLTQNRKIDTDLGTRHRAGIGMSEAADAVVVIVSEETGTISVAIDGMLKRHLAPQTLEKILLKELAPPREEKSRNPLKKLRNLRNGKEKNDTDEEA